jgi:pimeloyl-ACP methyl ester carboxylesterase
MSTIHGIRTSITGLLFAVAVVASGCASGDGQADTSQTTVPPPGALVEDLANSGDRAADDVLLVHGAWADGSSWTRVIERLQTAGFTVHAVQLREQSLADDAALVRSAIAAIQRPIVVAGHSYGGAVMSEATAGATNVVSLVFVAAFAPDQGESVGSVSAGYPTPPAIQHLNVDAQGQVTIDPAAFVRYFAADVPPVEASALAAVQHPIAASILETPAGPPGWKTIPSFYQVSTDDQVIDPALERFFAQRMGATTIELSASHVSLISRPQAIARLIARAARK